VSSTVDLYPNRADVRGFYLISGFFLAAAGLFAPMAIASLANGDSSGWEAAALPLFIIAFAGSGFVMWRGAALAGRARANHQPWVAIDRSGVTVRDSFFWKATRFEWHDIDLIAVGTEKGVTELSISGRLGKFGRFIHVRVDSTEDPELTNARIEACMPSKQMRV
jgi:hypothetical protein